MAKPARYTPLLRAWYSSSASASIAARCWAGRRLGASLGRASSMRMISLDSLFTMRPWRASQRTGTVTRPV